MGSQAIFRIRPVATAYNILINLERKERAILLLLDGQRTLQDVARLTHRSDLEVAQVWHVSCVVVLLNICTPQYLLKFSKFLYHKKFILKKDNKLHVHTL